MKTAQGWWRCALALLVCLLASCVESDERAVISMDGRAWFTLHQSLPRAALAALGGEERLRQLLQQVVETNPSVLSGTAACWRDESRLHIAVSAEVHRWWRMPELLAKWKGERSLPEPLLGVIGNLSWHWHGTEFELRRTVDWRPLLAWSRFSPAVSNLALPLRYEWRLPVALRSNATRVEQGGCLHVWDFGLQQARETPLVMSLRVSLLVPLCGLLALLGLVLWRWRRVRPKKWVDRQR